MVSQAIVSTLAFTKRELEPMQDILKLVFIEV